jgi:hypothetical protein
MTAPDLSPTAWRKSSYSEGSNACVEVGVWRESSPSAGTGGNGVEVATAHSNNIERGEATATHLYLVRDSKDPEGPALALTRRQWETLLRSTKNR